MPRVGEGLSRDQSRDRPGDEMARLTVAEAADQLGISEAGVRKRVQRGQIAHERGDDGRLFVWVSPGETRHAEPRDKPDQSRDRDRESRDAVLVAELRDRLRFVERQLERANESLALERQAHAETRRITAGLVERIPAIEAPQETPGAPVGEAEAESPGPTGTTGTPTEPREEPQEAREAPQRTWWRRMFGG